MAEFGLNRSTLLLTKPFLNSGCIPSLIVSEYKGYYISEWARPEFTNGCASVGIVYEPGNLGSLIQVQRIEGRCFVTKEQAEQHGLELSKKWIDEQVEGGGGNGIDGNGRAVS